MVTYRVQELFDDYDISYKLSGKNISAGEWIGISCPYCHDKSNHGGVHKTGGNFSCWRCAEKVRFEELISQLLETDLPDAKRIVRKYKAQDIETVVKEKVVKEFHDILPKGMTRTLSQPYKDYLISRRYDPDITAEKYQIYVSEYLVGEFAYRILIPVLHMNQMVNYVARSIASDAKKKVINCHNENAIIVAKDILFGLDNIKNRKMIVVEGIFDAIRLGDGACATLGTQVSDAQVNLIIKHADDVFIMFDSAKKDKNAPEQAEKLANRLFGLVNHVEIISLDDGDPDDLNDDEVKTIRGEIKI